MMHPLGAYGAPYDHENSTNIQLVQFFNKDVWEYKIYNT